MSRSGVGGPRRAGFLVNAGEAIKRAFERRADGVLTTAEPGAALFAGWWPNGAGRRMIDMDPQGLGVLAGGVGDGRT